MRAVFLDRDGVICRNRDDHVKNFTFLLDDSTGDWSLTPAYDLSYAPGPGGEHSMTVAGEGRDPGRSHMLQLAREADITDRDAEHIMAEVRSAVSCWADHAANAGVSAGGIDRVAKCLSVID